MKDDDQKFFVLPIDASVESLEQEEDFLGVIYSFQ